jgi:tRNA (guanine-N7-)-methyltransferase
MTADPDAKPAEQFYGRRKGKKLRPNRVRLVDELLPKVQHDCPGPALDAGVVPGRVREPLAGPLAGSRLRGGRASGVAGGASQGCPARSAPSPISTASPSCWNMSRAQALDNVRIFPDDARKLMDALPAASLGRVFVLFNDPWPKTRHWERRFIGPANLDRLARLMKPGAELRLGDR